MNTPFSTASLYLDIISSLYGSAAKAGLLPPTKIFSRIKASLKELGSDGWKSGIDDEIFDRALRLTRNASHLIADDATAARMVIWSLTHSLRPLSEIALLKKNDLVVTHGACVLPQAPAGLSQGDMPQGALSFGDSPIASKSQVGDLTIMSKPRASAWGYPVDSSVASERRFMVKSDVHRSSLKPQRSKYLFPLRQSSRTPKQLQSHINNIVNALFKRARLPQATDPYQTVEALWAYAALRAGIPAADLVAYLGHAPLGLPVLKLSVVSYKLSESVDRAAGLSQGETNSGLWPLASGDLAAVGKVFLENPPRWYAMALRPGVRFTQLCHRIQLLSSARKDVSLTPPLGGRGASIPEVQLFYPCEEIARAIGKKIVTRQRPFIHSVVFFRAKLTDIGRLFSKIGDLAWCYRQSSRPGAPYAEISDRQFQLFQQTIARFTPDYEVAPSGELELKKNDRVRILGGLFTGHEATFDSIGKAEEGVVYRLNIVGDNGFDWRIAVDSRLAEQKLIINH